MTLQESWKAFPWHHGRLSRLDGEKVLTEVFLKCRRNCWLVRVSPATDLPAVSKVFPADQGDRYTLDPTITPIPKYQHYIVHQAEGTGRYYLVRGKEFGDIYQLVEYYKIHSLFEGTTEAQNRDSFSGEPAFLSGQMVCRDLMEHDAEIEEDVSEASDLSETEEEISEESESEEDIFDEEEESSDIPWVDETPRVEDEPEEENEEDDPFPDTASLRYQLRGASSQSNTDTDVTRGTTSPQDEQTSPRTKTFGQACSDFTKGVKARIKGQDSRDEDRTPLSYGTISDDQNRIYGDVDEDLDRVELAKVVNVQLEREKQKKLGSESSDHEGQTNSQQEQEYMPTTQQNAVLDRYEDVELDDVYANRSRYFQKLLSRSETIPLPKKVAVKPPQPAPRRSDILKVEYPKQENVSETTRPSPAERKISAPQLTAQLPAPKTVEISPASQLAQLEREQKLRQGEQDAQQRKTSRMIGFETVEEKEREDIKEVHVDYRPTPPQRQASNRISPDLSTISEESSAQLSRRSSRVENDDIEEDNEFNSTATFKRNKSLNHLSNDLSSYIDSCHKESRARQHRQDHNRDLTLILREVEQISTQMNKYREDLLNLEGRLDGLTSTLKQMILNDQLEYDHDRNEDDALSTISSLSNTTLTELQEDPQNGDIHDDIDDIYKQIGGGINIHANKRPHTNTPNTHSLPANASAQEILATGQTINGHLESHNKIEGAIGNKEQSPTSRQNVQSPPCRGSQLVVVRNYSPKYFDEIELKEKEIIAFMDELETGWWRGMKVGNPSPVGVFPSAYVRVVGSLGARPKSR